MTDTPIYDQVRRELRERPEQPAATPPAGRSRDEGAGGGVSVWALIDEHRAQRSHEASGRRRRA